MKKLILLCAFLLCFSVNAQAKTVGEATKEALSYFNIADSNDTSAIKKCRNYAAIAPEDVMVAATAIEAGILIPKNNVLNMDSEDLTPLSNGIVSYGIKSGEYKVTTGVFANGKIDNTDVTEETLTLCQLVVGKEYTALIKQGKCKAVVPVGDVRKPVLYKGRIFIADGNIISFDNVLRYSLGQWMDAGLSDRLLLGTTAGFNISADVINKNYIDKEVYIYADAYEPVVQIYGMRW